MRYLFLSLLFFNSSIAICETDTEITANGYLAFDSEGYYPPITYDFKNTAYSSEKCKPILKTYFSPQCRIKGIKAIRLYIELTAAEDYDRSLASYFSTKDNWMFEDNSHLFERVKVIHANNFKDLSNELIYLAQNCYIPSEVFISAHGKPNVIMAGEDEIGDYDSLSVQEFFETILTPCNLAPKSRILFATCNLSKTSISNRISQGLSDAYQAIGLNQKYSKEISIAMPTSILKIYGGNTMSFSILPNFFGEDWIIINTQDNEFDVYELNSKNYKFQKN